MWRKGMWKHISRKELSMCKQLKICCMVQSNYDKLLDMHLEDGQEEHD